MVKTSSNINDNRICPGFDICQHRDCVHYGVHKHTVICSQLSCWRPTTHNPGIFVLKTKPKCVDYMSYLEERKKLKPWRHLRPCIVED